MTPATIRGTEAACWSGAGLLTESRRRSSHQLQHQRAATALLEITTSD
jgi:hypothetical protein